MSRLKERVSEGSRAGAHEGVRLQERHGRARIEKVVVNMGLGEATSNAKIIDTGADELARITGQKPVTRAREEVDRAVQGAQGACRSATMVTLRGERMWEFLDRLISIALPRVRDFKGVSPQGFDGRGNYTLGLRDQLLFPEIDYMKVDKARGMNVSVVTTAKTDEEARSCCSSSGMPFQTDAVRANRIYGHDREDREGSRRSRSSRSGCATAAACAAGRAPTCGSSRCAACASASWRSRATSRA